MKSNKRGISLITLVITIIVMIILAAAIILALDNTGIISKANQAVDATNTDQVQYAASLVWAEAYLNEVENIDEAYIRGKLEEQGLDVDDYTFTVESNGVAVSKKDSGIVSGPTLGSIITSAEMYGTKINYQANGVTDWKVFYHTEDYVYLIASEKLVYSAFYDENKNLTQLGTKLANYGARMKAAIVTLGENDTRKVGQIYWGSANAPTIAATIQNPALWMAEWGNYDSYNTNENGRCVSYFLDENIWSDFANTEGYKDANGNSYVLGAIGTPTLEMYVASWNAKREIAVAKGDIYKYTEELTLTPNETIGYYINGSNNLSISTGDKLYNWNTDDNAAIWFASPSGFSTDHLMRMHYYGYVDNTTYSSTYYGVRPVVCLKSSIPASLVVENIVIK